MVFARDILKQLAPVLDSPEAIVITGMRRTGKTTILQSLYDDISSKNKVFLDLENPLRQKYFLEGDFEQIRFNLEVLGVDFSKQAFVFLDEIQLVKNIPQVVKYFYDHYKVKFFLTGSSSFYLRNLFSESLAGRKYIFELFPLSFKEFLSFKKVDLVIPDNHKAVSPAIFKMFAVFVEEYLRFGGFPGVVLKESVVEKKRMLADIFSSYFQLEVNTLGDFRRVEVIRDLIILLANRVGSKLDLQKVSSELGISRPTLYEYLSFLTGTYLVHQVKPFSRSADVETRGSSKFYFCDSGLLGSLATVSDGALFENNVFQQLNLLGRVNFYQKKGGNEIDFILNKKYSYEVKLTASQRDFSSLVKLSKEIGVDPVAIVSYNYSKLARVLYSFNLAVRSSQDSDLFPRW